MIPDRLSFWFGSDAVDRRVTYAAEYNQRAGQLEANALDVMMKYEAVCLDYAAATGKSGPRRYASGWRPMSVNDHTKNSAAHSTHMDAHAGDGEDDVDGSFAWWCYSHQDVLERHEVFMEHPAATVVRSWSRALAKMKETGSDARPWPWCHLSPVPPRSHLRVYFPDAASMPEWEAFVTLGGTPGITFQQWLDLQAEKT